jgi:hypothetical protein
MKARGGNYSCCAVCPKRRTPLIVVSSLENSAWCPRNSAGIPRYDVLEFCTSASETLDSQVVILTKKKECDTRHN